MKRFIHITLIVLAATLTLAACSKGGGQTQADKEAADRLAGQLGQITSYAQEGATYIEAQLKQDTALRRTPSGLVYKLTAAGSGPLFKPGDRVQVIYTGCHVNGQQFDSSNGKPVTLAVDGVVPGFKEMLQLMRPGATAHCIIPGNLAYGSQGTQGIAPDETLVFDITTVGLAE